MVVNVEEKIHTVDEHSQANLIRKEKCRAFWSAHPNFRGIVGDGGLFEKNGMNGIWSKEG